MSLPQHIMYGQGGSLWIDVLDRPANALVSGYTGDGTAVFASRSCTISTVNTLLNVAANRGALSLSVANATGIVAAGKFWLQDDPEEALVQKVSGGTITLRRPITRDHAVNAAVEGTRVSYEANATDANVCFWDGHLDWNIDGTVQEQSCFECTKYLMVRRATVQDLYDEDNQLYNLVDPELDIERALDLSHDDVMELVASKPPDARARVMPASREFIKATVCQFFHRMYRPKIGAGNQELAKAYRAQAVEEIERLCMVLPRDANQDGSVSVDEKVSVHSVRIRR